MTPLDRESDESDEPDLLSTGVPGLDEILSGGIVANHVRKHGRIMIVLDSLNGYVNAMPSEQSLLLHLHELLMFLGSQGVTTLITMTQNGIIGDARSNFDVSYVADTVILLRYFEAFGEVCQAVSVIKKRTGRHERTVREFRIDDGLLVGEPLREFRGVLTGSPEYLKDPFGEQLHEHRTED